MMLILFVVDMLKERNILGIYDKKNDNVQQVNGAI